MSRYCCGRTWRRGLGEAMSGVVRVADGLLRGVGGRTVLLRMPAPAIPADVTEQLGVATPLFQDVPLRPVVYRKARAVVADGKAAKWELLVSASAVEAVVGSLAYDSASVLFANAFGVVSDGELLEIESATAEQAFGRPYVYRLVVAGPMARVV